MNKKIVLLCFSIIFIVFLIVFFFVWFGINKEDKDINIPKNTVYSSENYKVVARSTDSKDGVKKPEDSTEIHEISVINNKTKNDNALISSSLPLKIAALDEENTFIAIGDDTFFVVYEYTELKGENGTLLKPEAGYVFKITRDGIGENVYKTKHIFSKSTFENGKISIYEKIYLDDMELYPSYYKPYILVKSVFDGNQFKEVTRKEVYPNK